MKVAIVGYRKFSNKKFVYKTLNDLDIEFSEIISGGACGVDFLAKQYAHEKKIPYVEYFAEWKKYGKKAGPIRNELIAERCELLIAFLHSKSVGTSHTISCAKKLKKEIIVVCID